MADETPKTPEEILIAALEGVGLRNKAFSPGEVKAIQKNLLALEGSLDSLNTAQKVSLAQQERRLKLMADEATSRRLIQQLQADGSAKAEEQATRLSDARRAAQAAVEALNADQQQNIAMLREQLDYDTQRAVNLRKISEMYSKDIKGMAKSAEKGAVGMKRDMLDIIASVPQSIQTAAQGALKAGIKENAALTTLTGVSGILIEDYFNAMDEFTNSIDTGFRGLMRSGIQFNQNLKDIFESSIDPIEAMSGRSNLLLKSAAENMGGMLTNIGLNGESANKALTALKNSTSFLRESFIAASPANEAAAAHFANLTQGLAKLGVAEEDTAVSLDFFVKGLKQTPKEASESIRALENMAHQLDINVSTAFKDFISLQGNLAQFGGDINRVFGDLQAQAVSTGVSVGDLNSVAERLDTFKGAAQAAQGFNAVLGQTVVSVTDLVHAEPAEKIQILKDALDRSGISFDSANRRVKAMIASFMGVDVAKASKIFGSEDDFFTLKSDLDGTASSVEALDKRINASMTNAEKMKKTLSSLGIASAEAVNRARKSAEESSKTLLSVIADMGKKAKAPMDILVGLRKVLRVPMEIESKITTTVEAATRAGVAAGLVKELLEQLKKGGIKIPPDLRDFLGGGGAPPEGRQSGGPVSPNRPYIVGDGPGSDPKHHELFVPQTAGRIAPNNDLTGGETTIQLQFNSPLQIVGTDGSIMTIGQFDKSFEQKFRNAALRAPNPVTIAG